MRIVPALLLAGAAAGCPGPSVPLTSIDGLAGGELTSELAVPAVTTDTLTTETVTANAAHVDAVVASTVEVSQTVTTDGVDANSVATEKLTVRGMPVYGAPLGVADYDPDDHGRGYRAVDAVCVASFGDGAHVCGADEVMIAYRAGVEPSAAMHQAAVVTNGAYTTVRVATGQESQDNFVNIDDCEGWTSFEGAVFDAGSTVNAGVVTNSYAIAHTYLALDHDADLDLWRLRPPFLAANCTQVKLACCG